MVFHFMLFLFEATFEVFFNVTNGLIPITQLRR
jgi:hypothetical protein